MAFERGLTRLVIVLHDNEGPLDHVDNCLMSPKNGKSFVHVWQPASPKAFLWSDCI